MCIETSAKSLRIALFVFVCLLGKSAHVSAEHLPIKSYTTADGLAHNVVNRIVRDSRGFLWFCTREGLSRFDGYGFTNYGVAQGLPSGIINDLLETRDGVYWVATVEGLCRFNPLGTPRSIAKQSSGANAREPEAMFTSYFPEDNPRSKYVLCIVQDRSGVIWCGTRNGLYRVDDKTDAVKITSIDLGIKDYLESKIVECILEDRHNTLWIGTHSGLYRRWPDGRVEGYTKRDGLQDNLIHSLLEDRQGRIWVGVLLGTISRLVTDPAPGRTLVERSYAGENLSTYWVNTLLQSADGTLWAGTRSGLVQFIPTSDGTDYRFRLYSEANGLSYREVRSLAEDGNGNLWIGLQPGGAAKIVRGGFTTFEKNDGLTWSSSLLKTRSGELLVVGGSNSNSGTEWLINRYDSEKFTPIHPQFPGSIIHTGYSWGWNQTVLEDSAGDWWIATHIGVCRFPKVSDLKQLAHTPPKVVYSTHDGLASNGILRLFEDSRGDIWIGSAGEGKGPSGLSRWERRTETFHHYTDKDNLPPADTFYVSSFAEDRDGNLWIGFSGDGGLVRYRDERFTRFTGNDGIPNGQIRNLTVDSAGRLWVPTYRGGLCRIDDPSVGHPSTIAYTIEDGLSSNEITAVTEDRWGRIYIGTGRGIDRLDPATGRIKHYTTADGLPSGEVEAALRDDSGALWFSFTMGLARLIPEPDPEPIRPPILITGLRIAGETQPISALGAVEIAPLELAANKNQLEIDFVALAFSTGEGLRYQYKLEGASDEWSSLADRRSVNFANLAPGSYRFLVRAVNTDEVESEHPASFSFTILHPIWQRWWFVALTAASVGLIAFAAYRYRVARLLELERIRTRIATDLHDDIGANLSLMAMASDAAQRRFTQEDPQMNEALSLISGTSRELVDSMGDIVWSVNPARDHLLDLVTRMRRFASDVFSAKNITFKFDAPTDDRDIKLRTETRREVLMIFKEAVNNIARHSGCTRVDIELSDRGGRLTLKLNDDGKGFDSSRESEGNGIVSMARRAERLKGTLEITSSSEGTSMILKMPLR